MTVPSLALGTVELTAGKVKHFIIRISSHEESVREAPLKMLVRWGTFFRADLSNFVKSPF